MERVIAYKTSDGQVWNNEANANFRESILEIRGFFNRHNQKSDSLTTIQIGEFIMNHAEEFEQFLRTVNNNRRRILNKNKPKVVVKV